MDTIKHFGIYKVAFVKENRIAKIEVLDTLNQRNFIANERELILELSKDENFKLIKDDLFKNNYLPLFIKLLKYKNLHKYYANYFDKNIQPLRNIIIKSMCETFMYYGVDDEKKYIDKAVDEIVVDDPFNNCYRISINLLAKNNYIALKKIYPDIALDILNAAKQKFKSDMENKLIVDSFKAGKHFDELEVINSKLTQSGKKYLIESLWEFAELKENRKLSFDKLLLHTKELMLLFNSCENNEILMNEISELIMAISNSSSNFLVKTFLQEVKPLVDKSEFSCVKELQSII